MRIPTSVIVMSLITATPFALAVRDTLHPQPKHHRYDDDMTPEQETAQYEAEMRRMQEEEQAEQARKQAVLKNLLGEKGKFGSYLDSVGVGSTREQVDAIMPRLEASTDLNIEPEYDAQNKISSLKVGFTDCSALRDAVRTQWGETTVWVDSATHVKTTFDDSYACSLEQQRYVEMEQFLDKTDTASIPLGVLGKRSPELDDDGAFLHRPGLEHTDSPVIQTTTNEAGKVVGLSVSFAADVEADAPIRARLDKLLGKGTQDPDTGDWIWKGKTPVHYAYSDAHVYLDIGQP